MHFSKSSVTGTHPLYISPSHSSVSVVSVDAEGGYDIFYDSIVLGVAGMCAARVQKECSYVQQVSQLS